MKKVIIFGGTTEGKVLAEALAGQQVFCVYCVATDYGKQQLEESAYIEVHSGRMEGAEMRLLFQKEKPDVIVDATHPYAQIVKREIEDALNSYMEVPFFRVSRDEETIPYSNCKFFDSSLDCAKALEHTEGKILLTTGSKELSVFCCNESVRERIVARVIPGEESLRLCTENGLKGSQIIAMQGPFSVEMNLAFLKETDAKILVMKEGGKSGGEAERIEAAQKANICCYIIRRPKETSLGDSLSNVTKEIQNLFGIRPNKPRIDVTLAGFGMGYGSVTEEVKESIRKADVVFGAERLLAAVDREKEAYPYYLAKDILPKLHELMENESLREKSAVVLLSGDTGFFSGAKKLKEAMEKEEGVFVTILPGVSSVSAMAAKIGESWENAGILSTHGIKEEDWIPKFISFATYKEKVFAITSGSKDIRKIGELLKELATEQGFEFSITVGINLYEDERILNLNLEQCRNFNEDGLCIIFVKNHSPKERRLTPGLCDEAFERTQVPMSKEEVRSLSICKLGITENAVCYDIGSGSGSVAVELGLLNPGVKVYAIEYQREACELIKQNIKKFGLKNVFLVEGKAPDALANLPVPTHVFIGGSGGNLREILETLIKLKTNLRVVMNAVTLETVALTQELMRDFNFSDVDVVQLNVSKAKQAGSYHLMQGQNPVYITAFSIFGDK